MVKRFSKPIDIILLKEAEEYFNTLSEKGQIKVLKSFDKTRAGFKGNWFKRLNSDIWEFRIKDESKFIRLLAFWDKSEESETLIISTHGFNKKTNKTPKSQLEKAKKIRTEYFDRKN